MAAGAWVATGRTNHHVLVPATDAALVDAWFRLDFGQQHLHAVREPPRHGFAVIPRSRAHHPRSPTRRGHPGAGRAGDVLPRHCAGLARVLATAAAVRRGRAAELESDWATRSGRSRRRARGPGHRASVGCDLAISSSDPRSCARATRDFSAARRCSPMPADSARAGRSARPSSPGRGTPATARARPTGARRTWRPTAPGAALGFRPTFRRLHRAIT